METLRVQLGLLPSSATHFYAQIFNAYILNMFLSKIANCYMSRTFDVAL